MRAQRSTYFVALCLCFCLLFIRQTVRIANMPLFNANTASSSGNLEPIVLTFVLMGKPAALEGIVAIKSALMHSSRAIELHLIGTEDAIAIIEEPLRLVQRPYYDLNVTFHVLLPKRVEERLRRAELNTNAGTMAKLLIHEVMQGVEKTMFVDTDMVFVVDPVQLWEMFETLNRTTLMSFPTLGPESHPGQVCTCVMLLNLDLMRSPPPVLTPNAWSKANATLLLPSPHHPDILNSAMTAAASTSGHAFNRLSPPHRDQGIWWALWYDRRELFQDLPRRWDITACRHYYGLKLVENDQPQEFSQSNKVLMTEEDHVKSQMWNSETLVVPGILHFNCKNDKNVWEWPELHENVSTTWAPMVTSIVKYKWVWLNRGTGSHSGRLLFEKRFGVRWLDEAPDTPIH